MRNTTSTLILACFLLVTAVAAKRRKYEDVHTIVDDETPEPLKYHIFQDFGSIARKEDIEKFDPCIIEAMAATIQSFNKKKETVRGWEDVIDIIKSSGTNLGEHNAVTHNVEKQQGYGNGNDIATVKHNAHKAKQFLRQTLRKYSIKMDSHLFQTWANPTAKIFSDVGVDIRYVGTFWGGRMKRHGTMFKGAFIQYPENSNSDTFKLTEIKVYAWVDNVRGMFGMQSGHSGIEVNIYQQMFKLDNLHQGGCSSMNKDSTTVQNNVKIICEISKRC